MRPCTIELFSLPGDERLPAFRRAIRAALLEAGRPPCWQEYFTGRDNVPAALKKLEPPALLINGHIAWQEGSAFPDSKELAVQFRRPGRGQRVRRWKRAARTHLSFLLAVFIAFFPKCPFCWAAYMSAFSSLGITTIPYRPWMLPVLIALFFANLVSLYYSRRRHGYKLLALSLAGAVLIVGNRLYWNSGPVLYTGAALLMLASLWNSLPARMTRSIGYYLRLRRLPT